jgi:hypothetical protein
MTIIQTIQKNDLNGYSQGVFANGLDRQSLYKDAQRLSELKDVGSFKIFLYNTLMWGDYNKIVGRYSKKDANQIVNQINNIDQFLSLFLKVLNDNELSISEKFQKFVIEEDSLKIDHIGFAYFTKFLHFYSLGSKQKKVMLILDKWLVYSWCALIIEFKIIEDYDLLKKLLRINKKTGKLDVKSIDGDLYEKFNNTMTSISGSLNLPVSRFEELIFGWDLRKKREKTNIVFTNPRYVILDILNTNKTRFK